MQTVRFTAVPLAGALSLVLGVILLVLGLQYGLGTPLDRVSSELAPSPPVQIGGAAPDFELTHLGGSPVRLSDYTGRPVVLYFWADWCDTCSDGMTDLVRLTAGLSDHQIAVLFINIMQSSDQIQPYASSHGDLAVHLLDSDASVTRMYGVRATPTLLFIDQHGVLRGRIVGAPRPSALEGSLMRIIPRREDGSPEEAPIV